LYKSGKEYLSASPCINSLQHFEIFVVLHDFLPLTIAELSTLQQVRFFGPPCILFQIPADLFHPASWHTLDIIRR